jgi:hypothetical protein
MHEAKSDQYPLKNKYDGEWSEGKRCGFGVYQYASGARYIGEWKNDFKVLETH